MTDSTPEPPWPIGAADNANAKRAGWNAYFDGKRREASPFPRDRRDLHAAFEAGWDAAATKAHPEARPRVDESVPLPGRRALDEVVTLHFTEDDAKAWGFSDEEIAMAKRGEVIRGGRRKPDPERFERILDAVGTHLAASGVQFTRLTERGKTVDLRVGPVNLVAVIRVAMEAIG